MTDIVLKIGCKTSFYQANEESSFPFCLNRLGEDCRDFEPDLAGSKEKDYSAANWEPFCWEKFIYKLVSIIFRLLDRFTFQLFLPVAWLTLYLFNSLPNKPLLLHVFNTTPFKTLRKKEKLLVTSM